MFLHVKAFGHFSEKVGTPSSVRSCKCEYLKQSPCETLLFVPGYLCAACGFVIVWLLPAIPCSVVTSACLFLSDMLHLKYNINPMFGTPVLLVYRHKHEFQLCVSRMAPASNPMLCFSIIQILWYLHSCASGLQIQT